MKDLYIPKGKTLRYETLACRNIVNDGVLVVEKGIQARNISGKGILNAGSLSCRSVAAMDIEAGTVTAARLAAERVCAAEVRVSGYAVVSCCLEAEYVETPRLTVALSQIGELHVQEAVNLPDKGRGIVGALLAGFVRRLWMALKRRIPVDADYEPIKAAPEPITESKPEPGVKPSDRADAVRQEDEDFELKRLRAMYKLLRPYGYTLRLVPLDDARERTGRNAA